MVIQLFCATGIYPMKLSGYFVVKIMNCLSFTHVVKAFRSTISGGTSIKSNLTFLVVLTIVLIILTIAFLEFKVRFKEEDFIEDDSSNELVS